MWVRDSVKALVLTASVIPKEIGALKIELPAPIDDSQPFSPPPFDVAKELFFQAVEEERARYEYALLCDESPRVVREAIENSLSVDKNKINNHPQSGWHDESPWKGLYKPASFI